MEINGSRDMKSEARTQEGDKRKAQKVKRRRQVTPFALAFTSVVFNKRPERLNAIRLSFVLWLMLHSQQLSFRSPPERQQRREGKRGSSLQYIYISLSLSGLDSYL